MKVITLTAPWSWFVAASLKRWETRSWQVRYRGPLGIHTAKSLAPIGGAAGLLDLCGREYFRQAMIVLGIRDPLAEPRGQIIAICNLRDIQTTDAVERTIDPIERAFGDYSPGRYAWRLDGIAKLRTPIEARGAQGLWTWEPEAPKSLLRPAAELRNFDPSKPLTPRKPKSFA